MSNIPKLDSRDFNDLLNEVKYLARQYTPEWNFDENSSDFGVVFAKLYCRMMESTLNRYNKTSYNHYLTFLNMLGTRLRPAASAFGMIVAKASQKTDGSYINKGTPLFANADTDDGMVIYETVDSLSAIDTSIKTIYFTEPRSDFIGRVYETYEESPGAKVGPFRIFDNLFYKNLQCHEIYFGDEIVFNMSNTNVSFSFYNNLSAKSQKLLPDIFSNTENAIWEYYKEGKWVPVDSAEKTETGVQIKFSGTTEPFTFKDTLSRFIRCRFLHIPDGGISVTGITYQSYSEELSVNEFFSNETELSKSNFFPFGEQYSMYSAFSFSCDEAFTKKGAIIEVTADIDFVKVATDAKSPGKKYKSIMTPMDFAELQPDDIRIEKVKWEYWNGSGWAKLNSHDSDEEFFKVKKVEETKRTIKFKCPNNIEKISVGSGEGCFIRARISKMHDQFDFFANYITPYINNVKVRYSYEGDGHKLNELFVRSDLREYKFEFKDTGLSKILKKYLCDYPAMYLCLSRPLSQGMIRIFIDIEEGIHRFNPSLKWEYLANNHKGGWEWKHIEIMDSTDGFSHSETITLIGKNDFKEATVFNETGYFLRIINPDRKYSVSKGMAGRPVINDIKFNAVKVIQKHTKEPEYFSINQDEENKLCNLSNLNVSSVEVWVDEIGKISTKEQEYLLKAAPSYVQAEYDDLGKLDRLWIKWKAVPNLLSHGMGERVYEIDYPKGEVLFGNGRHGKIPPPQYNESIRINYSICNGSKGNIGSEQIVDFVDTIVNIESIKNPSPIMGGVDTETIDDAAKRMFGQISGGNRLVSLADFENSICANDRNIYKVKCLSHVDEDGKPAMGVTSIAVLPRKFMQGYEKFQGIRSNIWKFVDDKAPATLSGSTRLRIFEVGYVETCVSVDVIINDFNSYQGVYKNIESRLKEFLNPVSGNFSRRGWKIGEFPRKEFIYNYIKTVPDIKWIKKVNIFTNILTPEGKKETDFEKIKNERFVVPVFGDPEINITVN